ncbi:PREDICTED: Fanconi anemia group I protein homolog [Ceratosolen solmsi marchali]|uniref:Fanconi anemia group I protein homolog n=1 Tax=Ceratosolen solmsi marchali TaxID=326594 RepID=A0AAJ7DZI3_9HYME|nr:PREDICTED: Fanconi anemia group I protein homolog [Ceratosolen solmsi marchali]
MYLQYKNLLNNNSQSKFQKFVKDAEIEELCNMVLKVINTSEVLTMLDNILQGFSELDRYHDKRQKLVKKIFDATCKANVNSKHVDAIVSKIAANFSMFDKAHLVNLVDYFIERIRNNDDSFMSWKDLLPLLLEKIEEEKFINYRGSDVSGQEYKIIIIRSICDIDWDIKILSSIAKMFVELIIDIKDKAIWELIMKALTSKLMTIDFNELPPLVHQILKLGYNGNSILLFSTLSKYFAKEYASLSNNADSDDTSNSIISSKNICKELQEVESTVLYYIHQSVLDNTKGSLEYIRCLKSIINAPEYVLDTFVISILLLISDLYEDQTLQILKLAFLRQIQDEENGNHSAWLRQISSNKSCALETINKVIENSNKDRQLILKGMVDFAFILLSTERKVVVVNYLPWSYGNKILQKIARKRHDAAGTILELLVDKIVRSGSNTFQYTDCLAYMCRRLTMTILDHQIWIMILLDQLLVIPGSTASQILKAILPLMRISSTIRDNLIMILRKALYRKGIHTRQMAVFGFLQLLKNLKLSTLTTLSQSDSLSSSNVASSSSFFTQATLERSSQRSNPWHNTSLCREILAILSKCFTHEIEVRSHLYKELYYGVVKNQELTEYVIEMLLEHFFQYYEKDEKIVPPLYFEKCSSDQGLNVIYQEPLPDLICALQKIYLKVALKDSSKIDQLAEILESLCKRMAQTDVEHMSIDEDIDILDNSSKAQQKLLNIKIAISVYETLIAYKIASWSLNSLEVGQSIISLFKGYTRLTEYLKNLSKSRKGGGKGKKDKSKDGNDTTIKKSGRMNTIKLPNTVMSFETISKSIVLLYNQSNSWATSEQTSDVRGRMEFHIYILQTCLQLLQNVEKLKDQELQNCLELNKRHFLLIGETLYKYMISDLKSVSSFHELIATLGTECFKELCNIMCTYNADALPAFIEAICGVNVSRGLSSQLQEFILLFKDIFILSLDEEIAGNIETQNIPLYLIETIFKFVEKITFNEIKVNESFNWLNNIAENQKQIDVQVASLIVQLMILVDEQNIEYSETIQDLCAELFPILGRIDKIEVSATRKFQIINEANVYPIFIIINKVLSSKLQNINWLLCRLNAEYIAINSLQLDSEFKQKLIKSKEQALCRQFTFILGIFEILTNIKIAPGQASEILFKNLQKVYNFACSLAKYFRKKSSATNPAFQSVKFIPVIQGAGNALKESITELILHIESTQSSGKSNDVYVQRNKILKEVMVIPGVVQAIDMFDKEIALLTKKTGIDLMKYIKYDVIRDFRIQNTQLMENLEKMNVSLVITQSARDNKSNDVGSESSDDQTETKATPVKRQRTK